MSLSVARPARHAFIDPITNQRVTLIVPKGGYLWRSKGHPLVGVEHPGCDQLADVSLEYDAFYCPTCRWNGRVSGAWVVDLMDKEG